MNLKEWIRKELLDSHNINNNNIIILKERSRMLVIRLYIAHAHKAILYRAVH